MICRRYELPEVPVLDVVVEMETISTAVPGQDVQDRRLVRDKVFLAPA